MVSTWTILINYLSVTGLVMILAYFFGEYMVTTERRRNFAIVSVLISLVVIFFLAEFKAFPFMGFYIYVVETIVIIDIINRNNKIPTETIIGDPVLFEERVKKDLGLGFVTIHKKQFPNWLKWIGGFMTPLFPAFYVVNTDKTWEANNQEAVVHELMHIKLMMQGFLVVMMTVPTVIYVITSGITHIVILQKLSLVFGAVMVMVGNEYVTFHNTAKYCDKNGIPYRPINNKIFLKYFVIYSIYMLVISLITRWLI
jgi:hypothetical protein